MKKLILAFAFFGFAAAGVNAQAQTAPVKEKKQTTVVKAAEPKAEVKKTDAPKTDANGATLKKDGTPDKRYKANKEPKPVLKKDGTPDKRYKANKESKPVTK